MTIADEIIAARDCGKVHCGVITQQGLSLQSLTKEYGLRFKDNMYNEICESDALVIATAILNRDLAYNYTIMPIENATKLAGVFINQFQSDNPKYFTNGDYYKGKVNSNRHILAGWSFVPATDATFDTGVIIVGARKSGCLWVEDED